MEKQWVVVGLGTNEKIKAADSYERACAEANKWAKMYPEVDIGVFELVYTSRGKVVLEQRKFCVSS